MVFGRNKLKIFFKIINMKINKEKLYNLYMKWVEEVTEECDWKTSFGPEEIVNAVATILEKNPDLVDNDEYEYFMVFYLKPDVRDGSGLSFRMEKKSIRIELREKFMEKYGEKMKGLKITESDVDEFIRENQ
jgi:hypothetical protein